MWSLPALGFLGTASEMAHAVSGLGETVAGTNSYTDLRGFLVQDVIPPLANAFGVTLLALACAVVCHLALTLAHTYEQRFLLEADSVTLETLAARSPAIAHSGGIASPAGSIDALAKQLEQLNEFLSRAGLDQLARLLQEIQEGLGQDLTVSRSRSR